MQKISEIVFGVGATLFFVFLLIVLAFAFSSDKFESGVLKIVSASPLFIYLIGLMVAGIGIKVVFEEEE